MFLPLLITCAVLQFSSIFCGNLTEQNIIEDITKACPFTHLCNRGLSKQVANTDAKSCCEQCSCDEDCASRQNCCPFFTPTPTDTSNTENPDKSTLKIRRQECILPIANPFLRMRNEYTANVYGRSSYNAITTCPDNYNNNATRRLCETDSLGIFDIRIVSDHQQFAYKNEYCAMCNGVNDYVGWDLHFFCFTNTNISRALGFSDELNMDVFDKCVQISKPPTEELEQKTRCIKGYAKSNETGKWQSYNEGIQRACESYTLPYTHARKFSGPINYNNIHCFLCNNIDSEPVIDTCDLAKYWQDGIRVSGLVQFTGLLNTKLPGFTSNTVITKPCQINEIYDSSYKKCRKLYFPLLQLPVNGKCVEPFLNSTGYSIAIVIKLNPTPRFDLMPENRNITKILIKDYDITDTKQLKSMFSETTKALKLPQNKCETCGGVIYKATNSSYIIIIKTYTTAKCSASTILNLAEVFRYFPAIDIALSSNTQKATKLHFQPELKLDYQHEEDALRDGYNAVYLDHKINYCSERFFLYETMNCPRVELNEAEFNAFMEMTKYNGTVSTIKSRSKTTAVNTTEATTMIKAGIQVCVEEYVALTNVNSVTAVRDGQTWLCLMFVWYICIN